MLQKLDVYTMALTTYSSMSITMFEGSNELELKKVKTYIWEGKN